MHLVSRQPLLKLKRSFGNLRGKKTQPPPPIDPYLLDRSTDLERLALQHRCIARLVNGPIIAPIDSPTHILDIGCGGGHWLAHIAYLFPEAELHGIDISDAMFDNARTLCPKVNLHQHDATKPFPKEWTGKFDLISCNFIFAWLPPSQWATVMGRLNALLKPNGRIQMVEPYPGVLSPPMPPDSATERAFRLTVGLMNQAYGFKRTGSFDLPGRLIQAGFVDVKSALHEQPFIPFNGPLPEYPTDDEVGSRVAYHSIRALASMGKRKRIYGGKIEVEGFTEEFPKNDSEWDSLLFQLHTELASMGGNKFPVYSITAQKRSSGLFL